FVLLQSVAGTASVITTFQHSCRNGMVMRFALHGNLALLWPDETVPVEFTVTPAGVGQPGIGMAQTPGGNAISQAQSGAIDRIAPNSVSTQVSVSPFRFRIDAQWQPTTDDANGSGLAQYIIYRDGNYFMRTTATTLSDETVRPGESHTY